MQPTWGGIMTMHYSRIFSLCAALALLSAPALAQVNASWANDQATADADMSAAQYQDALTFYERAVAAAESAPQDAATKAAISKMLVSEGNCLLKLKRTQEALAAYEQAAPLSPNPATAYFNICAVRYNAGDTTAGGIAACDRAIQFNPAKADAYFIKGSMLFAEATSANGKYVVPPGTVETLNKYLELAPNGPHAGDTKAMLDSLK